MEQQTTLIDFLTIRFAGYTDPKEVIKQALQLDPDVFRHEAGRFRYSNSLRFNQISVYYGGAKNMGICVQLTGEGCREYCMLKGNPLALVGILHRLKPSDAVTRIDIAKDDFDGNLNLTMISKMDKQSIRTKLEGQTEIRKSDGGHTIYFGARESEYEVRIYNKAIQMHVEGEWIRVEQVLRKKKADSFARYLTEQIDDRMTIEEQSAKLNKLASGLLLKHLAFIEPGKSNKSRAELLPWWKVFLDTDTPLKIPKAVKIPNIAKKEEWIRKSISQLLCALTMVLGTDWLIEILMCGLQNNAKRNSQYFELAAMYQAIGKDPALKMDAEAEENLMNALTESVARYFITKLEGGEAVA